MNCIYCKSNLIETDRECPKCGGPVSHTYYYKDNEMTPTEELIYILIGLTTIGSPNMHCLSGTNMSQLINLQNKIILSKLSIKTGKLK